MQVEVRLYATLRQYAPAIAVAGVFAAVLSERSTITELLRVINIAPAEVHMIMVNGVGVTLEHVIHENDRVGLFPPVGGG